MLECFKRKDGMSYRAVYGLMGKVKKTLGLFDSYEEASAVLQLKMHKVYGPVNSWTYEYKLTRQELDLLPLWERRSELGYEWMEVEELKKHS